MPVLAITCSLGFSVERALDIGDVLHQPAKFIEVLAPIVAARRKEPRDDLISALVTAQLGGNCEHELSNAEIYSFSLLLVSAASTTMSRQMGIALAALLQRPKLLRAVSADRLLMRLAIDESLRWMPADPASSRWATRDIDFYGVHMPKFSIVQLCVGAANRDPSRWERPDEYDVGRPLRSSLAFGEGSHICLGMWVARLGMMIGTAALLDRLPNLRLDPDCERPRIIGMYERSATALPVLFVSGHADGVARH